MTPIAAFQFIAKITGLFPILIDYDGCVFCDKLPLNQRILPQKSYYSGSGNNLFFLSV
jgi:hypothetical protein